MTMVPVLGTEIHEAAIWEGTIAEMGPSESSTHPELVVPSDFMQKVKKSDDDPMFVVVEVEAGMSKSKRNWKPEHLRLVVDKVNKERMSGNFGHPLLDKQQHESGFPMPQVAWCTATMSGNKAFFKGYVLKKSEARDLLSLGLIDGVSIFGDSTMRVVKGGYDVIRFDPETIDFARKGRAGMKSRIVELAGEQITGRSDTVEPKDITALSEDELRTHAPLLVAEIERKVTGGFDQKIGEMEGTVASLQGEVNIFEELKKLLKLTDGENPVEKLTNLMQTLEDASANDVKDYIKGIVGKKVKSTRGQALVNRLLGEMHTEYDGPLTEELEATIKKDVLAKIADDKDIQSLVGEMIVDDIDDDENGKSKNSRGGSRLGGRSGAGTDRGRGNPEKGIVSESENLVIRTQKL